MNNQEMRKVLQEAYCQLCNIPVKGKDTFEMANALARIEGVFNAIPSHDNDELPTPIVEEKGNE